MKTKFDPSEGIYPLEGQGGLLTPLQYYRRIYPHVLVNPESKSMEKYVLCPYCETAEMGRTGVMYTMHINLLNGSFECTSCGLAGHNHIRFHQHVYGATRKEALIHMTARGCFSCN